MNKYGLHGKLQAKAGQADSLAIGTARKTMIILYL